MTEPALPRDEDRPSAFSPPPSVVNHVPPAATPSTPPPRGGSMGRTVGGGMSWMLVATVVSKLATSVTQLLLGWWLLPEHFAKFAIATTIAGFLMLAKDAGIPNYLIKQGSEKYPAISGPAFWMCAVYNTAAAALMALAAWPVAHYLYKDDALAPMLWVMAFALPLGTPAAVLQAKLRLDLRFKQFSMLMSFSIIMRQVLTIVLAAMGFEALSLALPVVFTAVLDSLAAWWMCNDRPWKRPALFDSWGRLMSSTKWLINGTVGSFSSEWGPYLVLGRMVDHTITGYYFFAYQITAQIGMLLSFNLHVVLLPVLAKLNNEPARQREAFVRVLTGLTLVGSYFSLAAAVVMAPLESLLWHGKWSPAVIAVVIFGIFYPWRVSFAVTCGLLMAQGRFKRFSLSAWAEGLVLIGVTIVTCLYTSELWIIALSNGLALIFTRLAVTMHTFRLCGVSLTRLAPSMVYGWLVSVIAAAPFFWLDRSPMWAELTSWFIRILPVTRVRPELLAQSATDVLRILLAGSGFTLLFVILTRLALSKDVSDAVAMLPARVRGAAKRLLAL